MKTTKPILIFFVLLFSACGKNHTNNTTDISHRIQKLNDSAITLTSSLDSADYVKAIALLDEATAIDSNHYTTYWNKLIFQSELKQYDKALETAKHLNRIKPDAPDFYVSVGILYEKSGDSIAAQKQFQEGLVRYEKILDTMNVNSKNYDIWLMNKGINHILAKEESKGNDILKQLYNKQTDIVSKQMLGMFINKSRKEILETYQSRN